MLPWKQFFLVWKTFYLCGSDFLDFGIIDTSNYMILYGYVGRSCPGHCGMFLAASLCTPPVVQLIASKYYQMSARGENQFPLRTNT